MGKLFGTNGVRGTINQDLTVDVVLDLSRAIGTVLGPGKVAISCDSRMGGDMFTRTVIAGLLSTGCSIIDIGPAPTPTLQFITPKLDCVTGVMVTASHNPREFNGIKVMGANGIEVARSVENEIEEIYYSKKFRVAQWDEIGSVTSYKNAIPVYIEAIKSHVGVDLIKSRELTVVFDGANSVGSLATPQLLLELGCKVISLNSQLDGKFPGRNPEPTPSNLVELTNAVKNLGADLGIAHDGDADRAVFLDETGRILWGDQSFAIVAKHVLSKKPGSTLVTPVSSGMLIEDIAKAAGAKIDWTVVGSVIVSHRIDEINAEIGGEENGGVFYPAHLAVRDGAMTSAQIIDIMATEGKTLSQLVEDLPTYFSAKTKVPVPPDTKEKILQVLMESTKDENRITLDGIKLIHSDGWFLLRPSGTEPLWRCFAESSSQEMADELCKKGVQMIESAINGL
ncbi:MAG: phosphoglucosamine mutase [Candidatus Thorarchaeota archaeon]